MISDSYLRQLRSSQLCCCVPRHMQHVKTQMLPPPPSPPPPPLFFKLYTSFVDTICLIIMLQIYIKCTLCMLCIIAGS